MTQSNEEPHPLGAGDFAAERGALRFNGAGSILFPTGDLWGLHLVELSKALPEPWTSKPFFLVGIGFVSGPLCSPNHRSGFRRCRRGVPWGRRAATPLRPHFVGAAVGLKFGTTAPPASVGGGKRGQSGALLAAEALPCASYPCSPQHQQQDLGFKRSFGASRQERCRAGTC